MIRGTVVGDDKINVKLGAMPDKVVDAVEKRVQRVVKRLEAIVKADKLTGQVLHVRTGTLRRSIHSDVKSNGTQVIGTVGTNVVYAAFHEYGFNGVENVKEHMRQLKATAVLHTKGKKVGTVNKAATAKQPGRAVKVRAHTRQVNYPAHSFLRSTLREQTEYAKNEMRLGAREGTRL